MTVPDGSAALRAFFIVLPIALALFVGGIFLLVFNPQPKARR
ncbi:MAG: hypothetical protein ACLGHP_04975 [Vicinamibacteria bacterium]